MIIRDTVSRNPVPTHRAHPYGLAEHTLATCTDYHGLAMGWGCIEPWCPLHDPERYSQYGATHRSDERCGACDAFHQPSEPCLGDE